MKGDPKVIEFLNKCLKNELTANSIAVDAELGLLHACMAATQAAINSKTAEAIARERIHQRPCRCL